MADKPVMKDVGVPKQLWRIPALLVVIGLVMATGVSVPKRAVGSATYPIAADAQDIWLSVGETVKVKIYPDRWTGCVEIPDNAVIDVTAPGEIEYFFWKIGKRVRYGRGSPPCYLNFKDNKDLRSFWLRGDAGEAIITARGK